MAFLRFSRDKRGYENFYLVETSTNRRGKTRARVLYWFRTPPGVKVGREPFDADVRRALEAQNPNVVFDWRKISETPIPSPDADKWRERRRLERAERSRRRDASQQDPDAAVVDSAAAEVEEPDEIPDDLSSSEEAAGATGFDPHIAAAEILEQELPADLAPPMRAAEHAAMVADATSDHATNATPQPADSLRRRRRRRRRRGGHRQPPGTPAVVAEAALGGTAPQQSKELSGENEPADSDGPDDPEEV